MQEVESACCQNNKMPFFCKKSKAVRYSRDIKNSIKKKNSSDSICSLGTETENNQTTKFENLKFQFDRIPIG